MHSCYRPRRFDRLGTERSDDGTANMDLDRTDNNFSPRIRLAYEPIDWVPMYATYSRSFQPLADNGELRLNADQLKPEETTHKEVGAKFDLANGLAMTESVFDMRHTGIMLDDPTGTRYSGRRGYAADRRFGCFHVGRPWRWLVGLRGLCPGRCK